MIVTKRTERLLLAALLATFFIQGFLALTHMSATGDETHYLGMGRYLIHTHRWDLDDALLHPPLSYYIHSIPLLFFPIDDQVFKTLELNARGRALMALYPDDRLLMAARVPILVLATALGLLVFYWAKEAYGTTSGLFALFIYVLNPAILSSAPQITPDLCLTFFSTLAMYFLWRYLNSATAFDLAATGVALGLALLSKYSAVLVLISVLSILAVDVIRPRSSKVRSIHHRLACVAVVLMVALFVVNLGYFFQGSFRFIDDDVFKSHLFKTLATTGVFDWMPSPLPEAYVRGMDWQHTVVEDGFLSFLLGEISNRGWLHYYLIAFLLKTPVPLLVFLIVMAKKKPDKLAWVILVPVFLFPMYFSVARLSRGIRYILPIYPLLCLWVSRLALPSEQTTRQALKFVMCALLLWYGGSALWVAPHYIAYFNELGGGPGNGMNLLFESDFDWGQELKQLAAYQRKKNIGRIKLAYFSTADPAHYGVTFETLSCTKPPQPATGLIAASATVLQVWGCYDWLKSYEPVDKLGNTIFIYDIPLKR